jgi:hypothetical protein
MNKVFKSFEATGPFEATETFKNKKCAKTIELKERW